MKIFNRESFAKALILERVINRKITTWQVQEETGIYYSKLKLFEIQRKDPSVRDLLILCDWLDLPIDTFLIEETKIKK
jgi:hypothetical protein